MEKEIKKLRSVLKQSSTLSKIDIDKFLWFFQDQPKEVQKDIVNILGDNPKEAIEWLDVNFGRLTRAINAKNKPLIQNYLDKMIFGLQKTKGEINDTIKLEQILSNSSK